MSGKTKGKGRKAGPKKVKSTAPPGPVPWIRGTKLKFFDSRREAWQRAVEAGPDKAGTFYTNVTKLFFKKYGWDLKYDDDLAEDVDDPPDECLDEEDSDAEDLDEEVAAFRAAEYSKIRTKIAQWYRYTYRKIVKRDTRTEMLNGLFDEMFHLAPKPPRKMRMEQFYSTKYYETRIKPEFEKAWVTAQTEWKASQAAGENQKEPSRISVRNQVTKTMYEAESDQFKADRRPCSGIVMWPFVAPQRITMSGSTDVPAIFTL
ncbi:hypothetical protein PLICRDRAFT_175110 [Plicaturopsis crispa FD-325 SS-3]|nr:hypothetical protein PLICRDRAFT_175110 [Plicaturopsis crispa FD-325 SS-3]